MIVPPPARRERNTAGAVGEARSFARSRPRSWPRPRRRRTRPRRSASSTRCSRAPRGATASSPTTPSATTSGPSAPTARCWSAGTAAEISTISAASAPSSAARYAWRRRPKGSRALTPWGVCVQACRPDGTVLQVHKCAKVAWKTFDSEGTSKCPQVPAAAAAVASLRWGRLSQRWRAAGLLPARLVRRQLPEPALPGGG
jgi:hypothetical protein